MTPAELAAQLGIKGFRRLSQHTTVVEQLDGSARPASPLELRMWATLQSLQAHD